MRFFALQSLQLMQRCFQTAGALSSARRRAAAWRFASFSRPPPARSKTRTCSRAPQMHRNLLVATEGVAAAIGLILVPSRVTRLECIRLSALSSPDLSEQIVEPACVERKPDSVR